MPEYMHGGGVMINNASFVGTVLPAPVAVAYGATKAAVVSMTRAAALAVADQGIDVFAVAPYFIDTPMIDRLTGFQGPEPKAAFAALNPSGKLAAPEDVAEVVVALATRTSPYHSGDVLLVDTGPSVTIMS